MKETTPQDLQTQGNIGRRMIHVMSGIERIVKSKQMETGQKYKYVSHDQVVEAVRGLMCEAGIVMQQNITDSKMTLEEVEGYKGQKVTQVYYEMKMTFDFCNCDDLTDKVTVESVGMGIDRSDKASGKAMSYCKKYAILQAFLIPTGDDPDHDQNTQRGARAPSQAEKNQARQLAQAQRTPNNPSAEPAAQPTNWEAKAKALFKQLADDGLKDDASAIWKAQAANGAQSLYKALMALSDKVESTLNGEPEAKQ